MRSSLLVPKGISDAKYNDLTPIFDKLMKVMTLIMFLVPGGQLLLVVFALLGYHFLQNITDELHSKIQSSSLLAPWGIVCEAKLKVEIMLFTMIWPSYWFWTLASKYYYFVCVWTIILPKVSLISTSKGYPICQWYQGGGTVKVNRVT